MMRYWAQTNTVNKSQDWWKPPKRDKPVEKFKFNHQFLTSKIFLITLAFLAQFFLPPIIGLNMIPSTVSTVKNYDERAKSYTDWAFGSEAAAADAACDKFLSYIASDHGKRRVIVDVGCGPGRDLITFGKIGFHVVGIEPSLPFCNLASDVLVKNNIESRELINGDICDEKVEPQLSAAGIFCLAIILLPRTCWRVSSKNSTG